MRLRSLLRFRLRTLLVLMTLAALALAPMGQAGREYRTEQAALKQLIGDDPTTVEYRYDLPYL